MKTVWTSLGMYFLANIVCTIVAVMFVEGWPTIVTIAIEAIVYLLASALVCKFFPRLWWMAGFVITSFVWVSFWVLGSGQYTVFALLQKPSLVDNKNFYALLPLIAIVASVLGSYLGFRFSGSQTRKVSGNVDDGVA